MTLSLGFRRYDAPLMTQFSKQATQDLGKDYWVVTVPFTYYLEYKYSAKQIKIPMGYLSDGASVPRPARWFIKPWGKHGQACVVHDWLCEYLEIEWCGNPYQITRQEADKIFLEAMKVLEVPFLKRWAMYLAVATWTFIKPYKGPTKTQEKINVENALRERYESDGYFP